MIKICESISSFNTVSRSVGERRSTEDEQRDGRVLGLPGGARCHLRHLGDYNFCCLRWFIRCHHEIGNRYTRCVTIKQYFYLCIFSKWKFSLDPTATTCGKRLLSPCTWASTITTAPTPRRWWTRISELNQGDIFIYFYYLFISNKRLKQVGPYVFNEYHKKTNISFTEKGTLVNFWQKKYWVFNDERYRH